MLNKLAGRQWINNQDNDIINSKVKKVPAIIDNICQRCGQVVIYRLPTGHKYCHSCIGLGRVSENDFLCRMSRVGDAVKNENHVLTWKGDLTDRQAKVSADLLHALQNNQDHLVHAVTGAGKTEMLFKAVEYFLQQGKYVALATPRLDVVNELYPRMCRAFANTKIGKYHGKMAQDPDNEPFIICTTHQLLKYYQAFDLIIIDEVDAFPYVNNPMLYYGAKNAIKPTGQTFYLTATPSKDMLTKVKNGEMGYSLLQQRFHGGLLAVPEEYLFWRKYISGESLHPFLIKVLNEIINSGKPLLVFVPRIAELGLYQTILQKKYSQLVIASVHSSDKNRQQKVEQFRNREISILLTTTILERGVTFPGVQVIVIAADDAIYTTAGLVQIAGRVGCAATDQVGRVIFCYHHYTKALKEAKKQIVEMNHATMSFM